MGKNIRLLGWLEGSSFLILLLIAMPLKYIWGFPIATKVAGMAHGILFLLYVLAVSEAADDGKWPSRQRIYGYLASVLPLGTFVFDAKFLSGHEQGKQA